MIRLFAVVLLVFAPMTIWSQGKVVEPPSADAPRADQERWLIQALIKYGSHDVTTTAFKLTAVAVKGCVLSYTRTKRYGATKEQTLIVTTRTDSVKDDISIDLAKMDIPTIKLVEHMYPEVMTFSYRMKGDVRDSEIVLRQPAADAVKTTIERLARGCQP